MKKQINIKEILKNKVSLRNAYKFRFCAWAAVFLCSEILLMLQNFGAGIVAINIIRLLICMIIISMFAFSIKLNIEKSDELSNMNTLKANMLTAKIIFSLLICSAIIIYVFDIPDNKSGYALWLDNAHRQRILRFAERALSRYRRQ